MIFSGEDSTPVPLTEELFCHQRNEIFKRAYWGDIVSKDLLYILQQDQQMGKLLL